MSKKLADTPQNWILLPEDLRSAPTLANLKSSLKTLISMCVWMNCRLDFFNYFSFILWHPHNSFIFMMSVQSTLHYLSVWNELILSWIQVFCLYLFICQYCLSSFMYLLKRLYKCLCKTFYLQNGTKKINRRRNIQHDNFWSPSFRSMQNEGYWC